MVKTDQIVTAVGTSNIAMVKYWGRWNASLNLPTNSSISITLDETLGTKTSVLFSKSLKSDSFYIGGEKQDPNSQNEKVVSTFRVLDMMRERAKVNTKALIVSVNSFPSGAGLASSASGAATLTFLLDKALDLNLETRELSKIARLISGSSCRSLYGGFVQWHAGTRGDGSDSFAEQVVGSDHWPEVIDMVTIVEESRKKVSSSVGHTRTTETSTLFAARPRLAEMRVATINKAIMKKDFDTMARTTMEDSNSMHAACLDSYPPTFYLTDKSRDIINAIHELNDREGRMVAAYTFDAGPNAHLITRKKDAELVRAVVAPLVGDKKILVAEQGAGPRIVAEKESLIDVKKMSPK